MEFWMWLPSSTITSSMTMELTILTLLPSLHVVPMMDRFTLHLSPKTLPLPTMQPAETVALLPSWTDSCTKFSKRLFGFSVRRRDARSKEVKSLQQVCTSALFTRHYHEQLHLNALRSRYAVSRTTHWAAIKIANAVHDLHTTDADDVSLMTASLT